MSLQTYRSLERLGTLHGAGAGIADGILILERRYKNDRRSSSSGGVHPWLDFGWGPNCVCVFRHSQISLPSFPLVTEGNGGEIR